MGIVGLRTGCWEGIGDGLCLGCYSWPWSLGSSLEYQLPAAGFQEGAQSTEETTSLPVMGAAWWQRLQDRLHPLGQDVRQSCPAAFGTDPLLGTDRPETLESWQSKVVNVGRERR